MDISSSYGALAVMYMQNAEICYDHYYVIVSMNNAVDEFRRAAQAQIEDEEDQKMCFRSRMTFLYGVGILPDHLLFKFDKAKGISAPTTSVWKIKPLHGLWSVPPKDTCRLLKKWFWKAAYFLLEQIRKAAKTLKRHRAGIQAAIMNDISNCAAKGLNSKIEVIKRSASGYRNKDNFRTAILFYCGKLDLMPEQER